MIQYLEERGLGLRAVPTDRNGKTWRRNAFLTRTDQGWDQLSALSKSVGKIDRWRGTVYCERMQQPEEREILSRLWGDCGLIAGPFVFFGDPDLLAEIREALSQAERLAPSPYPSVGLQ
jgi:hypothetical protein